jgi:hypothetical protein
MEKKTGRPSPYKPEIHDAIAYALYKRGFQDREVVEELGITLGTLYNWWKRYPTFKEKCDNGKEHPNAKVVKTLFDMTQGYDVDEKIFEPITFPKAKKDPVTGKGKPGRLPRQKFKLVKVVRKHVDPNPAMVKYWLGNKAKNDWREAQFIDFNAKVESTINVVEMTQQERLKWMEEHGYTKK